MMTVLFWRLTVLVDDPKVLGGGQKEVDGNAGHEELAIPQDYVRGADLVHTRRVQGEGEQQVLRDNQGILSAVVTCCVEKGYVLHSLRYSHKENYGCLQSVSGQRRSKGVTKEVHSQKGKLEQEHPGVASQC